MGLFKYAWKLIIWISICIWRFNFQTTKICINFLCSYMRWSLCHCHRSWKKNIIRVCGKLPKLSFAFMALIIYLHCIVLLIILVTCGSCRFCLRGNYEVCNRSAIYGFSPKVLSVILHHNNWEIFEWCKKFLTFFISPVLCFKSIRGQWLSSWSSHKIQGSIGCQKM